MRAVVFDLDDTLIDESGARERVWREVCPDSAVRATLESTERWYWSDPARHARGRLDVAAARREIVARALGALDRRDDDAVALAARYHERREAALRLMPGALALLDRLRTRGVRLGLLTNGAAERQRAKLVRFQLSAAFESVVIEGELGYGKPDPRSYRAVLARLGAPAQATWIVGDDFEWEVVSPRRLGVSTAWLDRAGCGLPAGCPVAPHRIVTSLDELWP